MKTLAHSLSTLLSTLRARLILMVLLAVIPAFGLILYTGLESRRTDRAEAQLDALRFTQHVGDDVTQLLDNGRELLVVLSELPQIRSVNPDRCNRLLADLRERFSHSYSGFSVARPNGDVACSSNSLSQQVNLADRSHFQEVLRTGEFVVSDSMSGRLTGQAVIVLGYPLREDTGDLTGAVFTSTDLSRLADHLEKSQLPTGSTLTLIDRAGAVVTRYPEPERYVGEAASDSPTVKVILSRKSEGMVEARGLDGVERLYAFTPPYASGQMQAGRLSEGLVCLSEGGVDAVLLDLSLPDSQGLATFTSVHDEHPSVPLLVLTGNEDASAAIEAVRAGAQDYLFKGSLEGLLSRAVRYAIERQRSENQVRQLNEELEHRVAQRTLQLKATNQFLQTEIEARIQAEQEVHNLNAELERRVEQRTAELAESHVRLGESVERLRRTLDGAVSAIATTTEIRDPYTAGHQRRVSRLAAAIARELGLDADAVEGIAVAAAVHDIGKISVPAEILVKPGRLTSIELQLIRGHAQSGYEILRGIDFPWPIAEMVLQHHERLDGSGYPLGLAGGAIVQGARIIAVEAMASHRPYRPALGLEAAMEEIKLRRGIKYDPEVVDGCLRVLSQTGGSPD